MFRILAAAAFAALVVLRPAPALEYVYLEDGASGAFRLDEVLDILAELTGPPAEGIELLGERAPYPADLVAGLARDENGDPVVTVENAGLPFTVHFHGCDAAAPPHCAFLRLRAEFALPDGTGPAEALARVNDWNRASLFGAAFLDPERGLVLMHVPLFAGHAAPEIRHDLTLWLVHLADFAGHLGLR